MKTITTLGLAVLGGLLCFLSHRVIAQMANVKQDHDEPFVIAPASGPPFIGEQAIRALVERQNQGLRAVRPSDAPGAESVAEQTTQHLRERIVRVVVAQSGELAYEYGDYVPVSSVGNVKTPTPDRSYLRVWRKQNGEWFVDVTVAQH